MAVTLFVFFVTLEITEQPLASSVRPRCFIWVRGVISTPSTDDYFRTNRSVMMWRKPCSCWSLFQGQIVWLTARWLLCQYSPCLNRVICFCQNQCVSLIGIINNPSCTSSSTGVVVESTPVKFNTWSLWIAATCACRRNADAGRPNNHWWFGGNMPDFLNFSTLADAVPR